MQPENTENTVEHVGHARHVPGIFKKGDLKEYQHDERDKAHDAAHAVDDARKHQRLELAVGEHGVRAFAQQGKPLFHPAHRDLPNGEGNGIKQIEHAEHDRRAHERMRQHLVHAVRELDARVHILKPDQHAVPQQRRNEPIAVIRDDGLGPRIQRIPQMPRHLIHLPLQFGGKLRGFGAAAGEDFLILLQQLERDPPRRIFRSQQPGLGNGGFHIPQHGIKIGPIRDMQRLPRLAALGFDIGFRRLQEFGQPFARAGHGRHDREAQTLRQALDIDGHALLGGLIHHVQGQHHGNAEFQKLDGQVEVALQRARIEHVDDHVGPFLRQHMPGDRLLLRVGGQGIRPRQVDEAHTPAGRHLDEAFLLLHGNAGIVAHMLVRTGQRVEGRRLARIRIAREGYDASARLFQRFDDDVVGFVVPEAEREPRQAQGHRIAQRGAPHHFHFRAGDEPHVPDAPPQLAAGLHMGDAGFLPLLHPAQGNEPGFPHLLGDGTAFAAARTGFGAIMPSALSMAKSKHIVPQLQLYRHIRRRRPSGKAHPRP